MNANQLKNLYIEKLRKYKSFNSNQAPVVTSEQLAMLEVIAEVMENKK